LGYKLTPVSTVNQQLFQLNMKRYNKFNDVISYIENEYVDSVNREDLVEEGIVGILDHLDPHSQYITAEEFHEVNDPLLGNFEGIGIQFRIEKDTIIVVQTIPGGPSEKVGLLPGDRIVEVNDSIVAGTGITNREAMRKLKGPRGTRVEVSIYRRGLSDLIDFVITRDIIPTYSMDIAYMAKEDVGYIKLNKFSATTYNEFKEAVDELKGEGMSALILDLRDNAGGYLQAAIDISDEFLEKGKLIVYTEGENQPRETFYATQKGSLENSDIVILIDEGTASASEIVAGALQDNDRGHIVGRRSFGKGLVQRQLDFPDGSALRLTVARYYTPTGRCIQKPYDKKNGFEDYYIESYHRYLNGEMENVDSIPLTDSLKYTTPGGKTVYGGGGIMPDHYIAIEKDEELKYYNTLLQNGLVFRFSFEYADNNRQQLQEEYPDFKTFNDQFEVTTAMIENLATYAQKNGVKEDKEGLKYASDKIRILMKAFIGRNLYDDKGFYPIYHQLDKTFLKALDLLQKENI
jgi:carboxyl-terminal processing protease